VIVSFSKVLLTEWQTLQKLLRQAQQSRAGLWGEYFEVMRCLCW